MTSYESAYMRDRGHLCKKSAQGMGKEFVAGDGGVTAGTFVEFAGTDDITVITGTAKGNIIGVAMNDALVGETVAVQMDGYHWISVGTASALAPGDWVESDANGQAVEYVCAVAGDTVLGGYILSTPIDDDDCVCMKIQLCKICETQR